VLFELLDEALLSFLKVYGPALFDVVEGDGLLLLLFQLLDLLVALVDLVLLPLRLLHGVLVQLVGKLELLALPLPVLLKGAEVDLRLPQLVVRLVTVLLHLSLVEMDCGPLGLPGLGLPQRVHQLLDPVILLAELFLKVVALFCDLLVGPNDKMIYHT